jgi:dynein heavy chain, axonemal
MYDILNEIEVLEKTCNILVEKSKKIQEFQKTLDMDVSGFDYVEESKQNMNYRARLWRALNEWQELIDSWKNSPFELIEVSEISIKADLYTKTVIQCERNIQPEGSSAVVRLKKLVFDFRETMPIVEALGNKNLKNEHWEEIKTILNIPDFPLE